MRQIRRKDKSPQILLLLAGKFFIANFAAGVKKPYFFNKFQHMGKHTSVESTVTTREENIKPLLDQTYAALATIDYEVILT